MNRLALACLVVAALLVPPPAAASTFIALDVPDLARQADRGIVAGRVLTTRADWNPERTMIWTEAELLVTEDLAGGESAGRSLVLRVPGGRVGDAVIEMVGAPRLAEGEEVVVFVTTWPDGSLKVLGYHQGVSRLAVAADGATRLVGGSAEGMTLHDLRTTVRAVRVSP